MGTAIPFARRRLSWRVATACVLAGWLGAAFSLLVVWTYEIESILMTGPLLFIVALISLFPAIKSRSGVLVVLCAVETLMPLVTFLMIWGFRLSPTAAYTPVTTLAIVYLTACVPLFVWAGRAPDKQELSWKCEKCGYTLIGLTSPRCPECGTPFDPVAVQSAIALASPGTFSGLPPPNASESAYI